MNDVLLRPVRLGELEKFIEKVVEKAVENGIRKTKNFKQIELQEFLTRSEFAVLVKSTVKTVDNWQKLGIIDCYSIGGRRLYKRSEIEKFLIKKNNKPLKM